jgi:hypothetical protein
MIKFILEITRNNLFKYRKPERSPQKPSGISCQSVLILVKFPVLFRKFREKYMEFEEYNEEFEGKALGIFNSGHHVSAKPVNFSMLAF